MGIPHSVHSLRETTSVPYIPFTPRNLSTLNVPAFKSPALSTPSRGTEWRSLRVAFPTGRPQSCERGIKTRNFCNPANTCSKPRATCQACGKRRRPSGGRSGDPAPCRGARGAAGGRLRLQPGWPAAPAGRPGRASRSRWGSRHTKPREDLTF